MISTTILQSPGLSFTNVVAVLLLPIFIIPGIGGLKTRLYVARRSDNYGRLDTLVYSWSLSAISLVILYLSVGVATNDFTLVPSILEVSDPTTGSETGLRIPYLLGLYVAHFILCLVLGSISGAFAYNFVDDVQITDRLSKRELMLNRIAPGKDVVVRTKSGELFQGSVGSKWDTEDEEDLLLRSPSQLIDKEGETWGRENRGPYLYVDTDEISRISLADPDHDENLDPESAIDTPDRLQAFIQSLGRELYPENTFKSILTPPRIAITTGILTSTIFVSVWFIQQAVNFAFSEFQSGVNIVDLVGATFGILVLSTFQFTGARIVLKSTESRVLYALTLPVIILSTIALIPTLPSIAATYLIVAPFSAIAGLISGLLATYVFYYYRRAKSPAAIGLFTIGMAMWTFFEFVNISAPRMVLSGTVSLICFSAIWLFYVAIHGGPSKKQTWAKRLRRPLKVFLTVHLIIAVAIGPWLLFTPTRQLIHWVVASLPFFVALFVSVLAFYIEVEQISVNLDWESLDNL